MKEFIALIAWDTCNHIKSDHRK